MFIAMNRFKVALGSEEEFTEIWRSRTGRLAGVGGFKDFRMLRGPQADDHTLFASHTIWETREDFLNWTRSENFRAAHRNAGAHKHLYLGPPQFEGFEVVLEE
ncbi:MAG: antibiotic biosynthesis monooxygenase [Pseudomonadota bacterium]